MKMKTFLFLTFLTVLFAVNVSAQSVDLERLPKYVVVATTNGGLLSDIDVDIRIKKSKYRDELIRLEKVLEDDSIKTYTDLLNEMDELGFDFIDSFENKIKGDGILGDSKVRQNLIFRKRKTN